MYEIKHAGAKGFGVFANQLIPRGTRIFSERPLIALRQDQDASDIILAARLVSRQDQVELLKLSTAISRRLSLIRWVHVVYYSFRQTFLDIRSKLGWTMPSPGSLKKNHKIISIFRNNAFDLGGLSKFRQAVFHQISRLNHSCLPNAQANFDEPLGVFNVHSTREIKSGEELTLNYLPDHSAPRDSRQSRLQGTYNFACACPACDLSIPHSRDGEERRLQIHRDLALYGEEVMQSGIEKPNEELKVVESLIRLLEDDNVAGRELASLYGRPCF